MRKKEERKIKEDGGDGVGETSTWEVGKWGACSGKTLVLICW